MYYVKASSWLLVNETWGIAYGMVSYLKLAKLKWKRQQYKWMDDSTQDVTWWLEMVNISRKDFEVLSKGEGQATAWQPKNLARVKKEVLAFSWGTNQAKDGHINVKNQIYNEVFDGSDLIHLGLFKIDKWNQVTCSRWLCSRWLCSSEKININLLAPLLDEDWNAWLRFKNKSNSKGLNPLYL